MAVRVLVLAGTALVLALIAVDLVRHPAVLADPAVPVYLGILAVVVAGYVVASLMASRRSARLGAIFGGVVAVFWLLELWAGNLAPNALGVHLLYFAAILGALAGSLAGGFLGGLRLGSLGDGTWVGAWSGMLGGLVVCLVAVLGAGLLATVGSTDPQTIAEFHRSHAPDLTTYIVSDGLAGGIAHLVIGIGLGSLLGLAGAAAGTAAGRDGSLISNAT